MTSESPSKSDSIPIPMRRNVDQHDCLSDSETTVTYKLNMKKIGALQF